MAEQVFDRAFFDQVIDRTQTQTEKWDAVKADGRLPLWVADMDFLSPPAVTEALVQRAAHGVFGYTRVDQELDISAFTDWWRVRHQLSLDPAQVLLVPGVVTGMRQAIHALTEPGDTVVIQPPVYGPFFDCVKREGRVLVENRLVQTADGWQMDLAHLEDCFKAGSRLLLLCSPHNPVGRVWQRGELAAVLALCEKYNAWIFCDEIHADFHYPGHPFTPLLAIEGAGTRVLTGAAASKTFNIAGLQQANLVVPDKALRERIQAQMHAAGVVSGNLFALTATRAAYRAGAPWLDGLIAYLDEARNIVRDAVAHALPGVSYTLPEGTYLGFLDFRAMDLPLDEIQKRLNRPGGVALSEGNHFGEAGQGFYRLNFGCPHQVLRDALSRMAALMNER